MQSPRFMITLPRTDRELMDAVRGKDSLSMFILKAAVKEAEFQQKRMSGAFSKQHQPGHDSRREPAFTETRLDYSNS